MNRVIEGAVPEDYPRRIGGIVNSSPLQGEEYQGRSDMRHKAVLEEWPTRYPLKVKTTSSNLVYGTIASIAQWKRQLGSNEKTEGSSPSGSTFDIQSLVVYIDFYDVSTATTERYCPLTGKSCCARNETSLRRRFFSIYGDN